MLADILSKDLLVLRVVLVEPRNLLHHLLRDVLLLHVVVGVALKHGHQVLSRDLPATTRCSQENFQSASPFER